VIDYLAKYRLDGKVAFVTGGAGLLGAEICRALASAGAKTVVLDVDVTKGRQTSHDIAKRGHSACFESFDITDLPGIDAAVDRLAAAHGSLDIWVNTAYPRTSDWGKPVEEVCLDSWRRNVDMHLNGYSWTARRAALTMKTLGIRGSIINLGSIYGVVGNDFTVYDGTPMTGPMAYAAIKGGLVNLGRYLASYFGPQGIRVNTVCPGGVWDHQSETFVQNYAQRTPLRRMALAEEIAGAVLFLAGDLASYVTGATIMVDGGWTAI
jgi:NAD(P)-dependent dehydrogenase (short-subunit alcohol dehydrogenase family)